MPVVAPATLFGWLDRYGLATVISVLAVLGSIYLIRWCLARMTKQDEYIRNELSELASKATEALIQGRDAIKACLSHQREKDR